MSRYSEGDGEESFSNEGLFWVHRAHLALKGHRGKKALAELREAMLALPEPRLIANALCTVTLQTPSTRPEPIAWNSGTSFTALHERDAQIRNFDLIADEGRGVCAVGAYLWRQKVKAGMNPTAAFEALPVNDEEDGDIYETARLGKEAGLAYSLAWELAYRNDETYAGYTPEERFTAFVAWIDSELAEPPLVRTKVA